ncbi:MAG: MBL fold metallo-hydrolase [Acidobacteriota bacterium]
MPKIHFLGAAGTVTGSKHLLEAAGRRILVDCGLFQGRKELRQANWRPLEVAPESIDAVVLTHAHIDHSGYLPRLIHDGFRGRIVATPATAALAEILLRDAGKLQEEAAKFHNRHGTSKHWPAKPLYTADDGLKAAQRIEGIPFFTSKRLAPRLSVTFEPAGHILGSAIVSFLVDDGAGGRRLVFSGDLGRRDSPLQPEPSPIGNAHYVVMESTYGDRLHPDEPPADQLAKAVHRTVDRGGALIIPAFAIARTQSLLYLLDGLEREGRIPELPVYLDSPMALDATETYRRFEDDLRPEVYNQLATGSRRLRTAKFHVTRSVGESKAIHRVRGPVIILSASGMATGGRVLHHLIERLPRPETTVLISGYQAKGTRGWRLQQGEPTLRMFGQDVAVRAHIEQLEGLSAHGDQADLLHWLKTASYAPDRTFLIHGETRALTALEKKISDMGWPVDVPTQGQSIDIDFGN